VRRARARVLAAPRAGKLADPGRGAAARTLAHRQAVLADAAATAAATAATAATTVKAAVLVADGLLKDSTAAAAFAKSAAVEAAGAAATAARLKAASDAAAAAAAAAAGAAQAAATSLAYARTRAAALARASELAADLAARELARGSLSAADQAVFDRRLLVLGLAVHNGYWREIDACIGVCADFANDTAKDGLLHLTMFYAAKDAAKADAAYKGPRDLNHGPPQQSTRLHQVARVGAAGRVRVLVAAGADVNAMWRRNTPLHLAASNGHTAVVAALLSHPRILVNLKDARG